MNAVAIPIKVYERQCALSARRRRASVALSQRQEDSAHFETRSIYQDLIYIFKINALIDSNKVDQLTFDNLLLC